VADLWDGLLSCLDLTGDASGADGAGVAEFEGKNLRLEYHRLFGGQLLAQFARTASLTCPGKAVTSHTVWFYQPFRADSWLLRQQSPVLAHGRTFGRTFGRGDILTADGTLVASFAQEAMVRFRDADAG
jgi:acyl-CoA thioesterase